MTDFSSLAASFGELIAEAERLRVAATRIIIESVSTVDEPDEEVPSGVADLVALLERTRVALLKNPMGAQNLVEFLAAEGRRFEATDIGREWNRAMQASPHLEYLRRVWEATTLDVLSENDEPGDVPSGWVDLLVDVMSNRRDLEAVLAAMHPGTQ